MRTLKLMADYGCFPLWEASPGKVGNVNPAELPISQPLRTLLSNWAESYEKTLNANDPLKSGFRSSEEEEEFNKTGQILAAKLQAELGLNFIIKAKGS